jgi:hypothetical protein
MRKHTWHVLLLLVVGFFATPAGAQTLSHLLACLPENSGTMQASMGVDPVEPLPGGG